MQEQDGAKDVDIVLLCESFGCDFFDGRDTRNSSVVDYDVDLELTAARMGKVIFGRGDYVCWAVGIAHVGLNGDDIDAVLFLEGESQLRSGFGRAVGGVAQDKGCAFLREISSNRGTDSYISRINKKNEEAGDGSRTYLVTLLL